MNNTFYVKLRILFKFFSILILGLIVVKPTLAQVIVPFSQRTSMSSPDRKIYSIRGDFTMIGNTNLTLENYGDQINNSFNQMKYVDVDNDPATLNSSSATLQFSSENGALPECSTIIFAGLYWSGRSVAGNEPFSVTTPGSGTEGPRTVNLDKKKLKLKGPGETTYTSFQAKDNQIHFPLEGEQGNLFVGYVEITEYVQQHGLGEYTVADLAIKEDLSDEAGYFGGWSMLIIYENAKMNWRDITSFDGFAFVDMNVVEDFELPVSGFNAIQHGPVAVKLGIMVGEGDVDDVGDFLEMRDKADTDWYKLVHEQNSTDNFFNSSITGGNPRNPHLSNNTGIDISLFNIPNVDNRMIGNGQTSTRFRYGSAIDTYVIYNLTFAVDTYVPELQANNSILRINQQTVDQGPYSLKPGEEIDYELQLKNVGTENLMDGKIVIPIPPMVRFVRSQTMYSQEMAGQDEAYFDPDLGTYGSIVWPVGNIPLSDADGPVENYARLMYTLKAIEDCSLLSDEALEDALVVNGTVNARGVTSQTSITDQGFIFGYTDKENCQGDAILTPVQVWFDKDSYLSEHCSTPPNAQDDAMNSTDGETVSMNVLTNDQQGSFQLVLNETRFIDPQTNEEVTSLSIDGEGMFTMDAQGKVIFVPVPGFNGLSKVNYIIYDEQGLSDQATVTVTVVYHAPVAEDDQSESDGTQVLIEVLGNDQDGSTEIDPGSVKLIDPTTGQEVDLLTLLGKGTFSIRGDGVISFIPQEGFEGQINVDYVVRDKNGVRSNQATISIAVTLPVVEPVKIPNAFTPNGDGWNDTFVISGSQGYSLDISIFNRWGNEVYKNRDYKNDWTGRDLNEGTYYYQLKLRKDGKDEIRKGWILLKR